MREYSIYGGDKGVSRLDILQEAVGPTTDRFLSLVDHWKGIKCLDLACGTGHVAFMIAQKAGPGGIIHGIDLNELNIRTARLEADRRGLSNIEFRQGDAYQLEMNEQYDIVYTRFLLSHLHAPARVLENVKNCLSPEGSILIEDTDFTGHFSHPQSQYFDSYVRLYQQLLAKRGADANIGKRLFELLIQTGFEVEHLEIAQPAHTSGVAKRMAEITYEGITDALVHEGIISEKDSSEIQMGIKRLREQSDSLMSLPRIFQLKARPLHR